MKKLLLTLFIMFITSLSSGAIERISSLALPSQSYLVLLEAPADVVLPSNKSVIDAEILNTIFNERTQILVKTLKEGISRLYITSGEDVSIIEFNVNENSEDVDNPAMTNIVKAIVKLDIIENPQKQEIKVPIMKGE